MPEPSAFATLGWLARGKSIAAKSSRADAEAWMTANNAPSSALRVLKSPVDVGVSGDLGVPASAWAEALQTRSAFFRMLNDNAFTRAPLNTHVSVTHVPQGQAVAEGAIKPISPLSIDGVMLEPQKAASMIVVSGELMRNVSPAGQTSLNRSLMSAVAAAVDSKFLAMITATATPIASSGDTAAAAKADLRAALLSIDSGDAARMYWIAGLDTAKRASTLDAGGLDAFAAMSAGGGEMAALPCLVSSGIAPDLLLLVDASAIVADGGQVSISASSQVDVELNTVPSADSSSVRTSMFQSDLVALRAETWFAAQTLRDNAVAMIAGITWGGA